ncbi:MAG: hypothetical protein ABIF85_01480 [Nanoarchaeota archaeon]|nr:hypothetical protein [Nanoarchaeota archaeon]MBU4299749.1 hypothetical protein [Nanoarchaeota archaeon]MBU4452563.1 hypothetical protein [Nanoarchaeota archaeon]MCG2723528.1 hypothetical protein [archaeon]
MTVLDEASVLKCISNLAKYDGDNYFIKDYRILLVTPNIFDELSSIETGAHQLKMYRGNDAIIARLKTAENSDEAERKLSTELSVIVSEESPELRDIMTSMQYLTRREMYCSDRIYVFNKEHFEKGGATVRENIRGHELDLTGKTNMFINEILER